jgi:hypothetical protein
MQSGNNSLMQMRREERKRLNKQDSLKNKGRKTRKKQIVRRLFWSSRILMNKIKPINC